MIRPDVTVWRRAAGGASAILVGFVGALTAQPRTDVFSSEPDAFAYLHEVATHPRCMSTTSSAPAMIERSRHCRTGCRTTSSTGLTDANSAPIKDEHSWNGACDV